MKWFVQPPDTEPSKHHEGDYFLNNLERGCADSLTIPNSVGWHHEAVFKKRDAPRYQDRCQQWHFPLTQVSIPGPCHEDIRYDQKANGRHHSSYA
jgi:hypothetical protein